MRVFGSYKWLRTSVVADDCLFRKKDAVVCVYMQLEEFKGLI